MVEDVRKKKKTISFALIQHIAYLRFKTQRSNDLLLIDARLLRCHL